jgi:hypothetical protein
MEVEISSPVRERLNLALSLLRVNQGELARKIDYKQPAVSRILKAGEPTDKFINKVLSQYPKISSEYILFGKGQPLVDTDLSAFGFSKPNEEVTLLRKEMEFMAEAIKELKGQLDFYKQLISQAYKLNPELQGKLLSSLSLHGQNGDLQIPFLTIGDYTRDLAAA